MTIPIEASQPSLNNRTTDQVSPVPRWNCCINILQKLGLIILIMFKMVISWGLLLLLLKTEKVVKRPSFVDFYDVLVWIAIFTDTIDIFTGPIIILSVCLKSQGIMKIYYKYSFYICGILIILCCTICYILFPTMIFVLLLLMCFMFLLGLQMAINDIVKCQVQELRSNEQFRL